MTKKHLKVLFIVLFLVGGYLLYTPHRPIINKQTKTPPSKIPQIYHPHVPLHDTEVAAAVTPNPKERRPVNFRSQNWQKNLESTLSVLGGKELKEIQIKRIETIVWKQDNMLFNAESVMVSLTNQQGHETSFRAIVDAQNGKILQTWDQPVIDHVNPRENFGIRLDPRYENL